MVPAIVAQLYVTNIFFWINLLQLFDIPESKEQPLVLFHNERQTNEINTAFFSRLILMTYVVLVNQCNIKQAYSGEILLFSDLERHSQMSY